jgi:hypothetical protein
VNDASAAIRFALSQLGKPYLWGATGPDSYDCSGLMVKAYQTGDGIDLPRTTQAMLASDSLLPVNTNQLKPGDLVFPSTEHVQMYLGGGKVIEAPHSGANVRIVSLGTVFQARRVTNPASGDWGSGSPVSAAVSVDGNSGIGASDVAQIVGTGLTNTFTDIMKPLLTYGLWVVTSGVGLALMVVGAVLLVGPSKIQKAVGNEVS